MASTGTEDGSDILQPWNQRVGRMHDLISETNTLGSKWDENRLGWHEDDLHDALKNYGEILIPGLNSNESICSSPQRVFVPLCGKSVDMAYLAKSSAVLEVVGVDGVYKALDSFRQEHPTLGMADTQLEKSGDRELISSCKKVKLICTDFFGLVPSRTEGKFDVIFDRASLVAINPSLREEYVKILNSLLKDQGKILLVAIKRVSGTEKDKEGPPFSIPQEEVIRLFASEWNVTCLEHEGETKRNEGADMISSYYMITRCQGQR